MTARTEAAGVGMSVGEALAVFERDSELAWLYRDLCDGDIEEAEELAAESKAALATLQSRLLAADELREAIRWYLDHESYRGRHEPMQKALAAYDKAGTNEH